MKPENREKQIRFIARGLYKDKISKTKFEDFAVYFYHVGQSDAIDKCLLAR